MLKGNAGSDAKFNELFPSTTTGKKVTLVQYIKKRRKIIFFAFLYYVFSYHCLKRITGNDYN